jgi:hypothetical protein
METAVKVVDWMLVAYAMVRPCKYGLVAFLVFVSSQKKFNISVLVFECQAVLWILTTNVVQAYEMKKVFVVRVEM